MKERQAIVRLKRGDIGGLEPLVQQYQLQAVRAAFLVCRDRALAEDIVQAAFLRTYERISQFDDSRSFRPWFLRSVVNDARKASIQRERLAPLEEMSPESEEYLISPEAALDELMEARETSKAIENALDKLTPGQRTAIVLRYYLGLSESEMSANLGRPPGTIKWRLHVARDSLRRLLPSWIRDSPD
ncbi:MAG TPA: RNA polymerase sigma factor [Chloroflexia bacterium]|jgi:RNA polymerase sigma-70 factor (ECF subfamily)